MFWGPIKAADRFYGNWFRTLEYLLLSIYFRVRCANPSPQSSKKLIFLTHLQLHLSLLLLSEHNPRGKQYPDRYYQNNYRRQGIDIRPQAKANS